MGFLTLIFLNAGAEDEEAILYVCDPKAGTYLDATCAVDVVGRRRRDAGRNAAEVAVVDADRVQRLRDRTLLEERVAFMALV